MKPITFACRKTLSLAPEAIANQILDLAKWPDFRGYGPIPRIKTAEFESRTANVVADSGRWSSSTGRAFHPQDSYERFQICILHFIPLSQACLAQSHRPRRRTVDIQPPLFALVRMAWLSVLRQGDYGLLTADVGRAKETGFWFHASFDLLPK